MEIFSGQFFNSNIEQFCCVLKGAKELNGQHSARVLVIVYTTKV